MQRRQRHQMTANRRAKRWELYRSTELFGPMARTIMLERSTDKEALISQEKRIEGSVEQESNLEIPSLRRQFPATRKRGKCMSRRAGQNPSVRTRLNRTKGIKEYFFQYWIDVPGREERRRETEVIGPVKTMTKSEAERKNQIHFERELKQIPVEENEQNAIKEVNLKKRQENLSWVTIKNILRTMQ